MRRWTGMVGLTWASLAWATPPVAIDVGHYLARSGATSAYGVAEFEYNHSLAAVIAARLAAGSRLSTGKLSAVWPGER